MTTKRSISNVDLTGKVVVPMPGRRQRQTSGKSRRWQITSAKLAAGIKGISIEGLENCDWVLIDGGDVIVHLFRPEVEFYNLEKLGRPCRISGRDGSAKRRRAVRTHIVAVGRLKRGAEASLYEHFADRVRPPINCTKSKTAKLTISRGANAKLN